MAQLTREIVDAEHYVARYARGGLTEQEREAFEEFCLMNPEVAREVGTDRVLLAGLAQAQPPRAWRSSWANLALAAGLVALALALGVWLSNRQPGALQLYAGTASAEQQPVARLTVMVLRDPRPLRVELTGEQRFVELRIYPNVVSADHQYSVRVSGDVEGRGDETASPIQVSGQPEDDDAITLVVGVQGRQDARLKIQLSGSHGNAGEFEVQLSHRR